MHTSTYTLIRKTEANIFIAVFATYPPLTELNIVTGSEIILVARRTDRRENGERKKFRRQ